MSDPLLQLTGVVSEAGGTTLHRPLDLTVEAGEIVAVMGPSGTGKTTLLRTVAGLIDPAEGTVALEGKSAEDWGYPAYRRRVVYVAQQPAMRDATVEANLRRAFAYSAAGDAFPEESARRLLDRVGIGAKWDEPARRLSVGEQQRVALVRALLVEPRVVLLDEPTSALDEASVDDVETWLRELSDEGLAIVVVTHSGSQAERLGDQTVRLQGT